VPARQHTAPEAAPTRSPSVSSLFLFLFLLFWRPYRPRKLINQVMAGRMVPLLLMRPLFVSQVSPSM